MNKKLIKAMHWLVVVSLAIIFFVSFAYHLDLVDYGDSSGQFGNSLGYAFLYFWALVFGFIGWILSIVLVVKERHSRTKHSKYATMYLLLGIVGFSWAYYLIQAS